MSVALGVGDALSVALEDAEAVAVGVTAALGFESELRPFAQTMSARRMIPTTTTKTTRPDAPGFFSCVDAAAVGAGAVGTKAGAGAGVAVHRPRRAGPRPRAHQARGRQGGRGCPVCLRQDD